MIELWKMTFYWSESGLESLLQKLFFSLCDHYSTICLSIIVLTILKIASCLKNKPNKKSCFYLFITYNQYLFYISQNLDLYHSKFQDKMLPAFNFLANFNISSTYV